MDYDVAIIGSGYVGISTAYWLQRYGYSISLIDPSPLSEGAYYGNACTIANYANIPVGTPTLVKQVPRLIFSQNSPLSLKWSYAPKMISWFARFLVASRQSKVNEISKNLSDILSKVNDGLHPILDEAKALDLLEHRGFLELFSSEDNYKKFAANLELSRKNGTSFKKLSQDEIADLEPNISKIYACGNLYDTAHHMTNPLLILKKIFSLIQSKGGEIITGKALGIKRISTTELSVVTDSCNVSAKKVIVCAGAWSNNIASQVGDKVPLDVEQGYHVMYGGAQDLINRVVSWNDDALYMTPMDTGLRAAGTVELGGVNNPLNQKRVDLIASSMKRLLPQLDDYDSSWTGYRPSMPDSKPVIGSSKKDDNIFYAFGHGHLGITLSGITGKIIADLVDKKNPDIDISPFSVDRFGY